MLGDAASVLPHLVHFTPQHRAEAVKLQEDLTLFHVELDTAVGEIWRKETDTDTAHAESWAKRMEQVEKARWIDPIDRISKPELTAPSWRVRLLDASKVAIRIT
jgi:elongator complex protein 1